MTKPLDDFVPFTPDETQRMNVVLEKFQKGDEPLNLEEQLILQTTMGGFLQRVGIKPSNEKTLPPSVVTPNTSSQEVPATTPEGEDDMFDMGSILVEADLGDFAKALFDGDLEIDYDKNNEAAEVAANENEIVAQINTMNEESSERVGSELWDQSFVAEVSDEADAGALSARIMAMQLNPEAGMGDFEASKLFFENLGKLFPPEARDKFFEECKTITYFPCAKDGIEGDLYDLLSAAVADVVRCVFASTADNESLQIAADQEETIMAYVEPDGVSAVFESVYAKYNQDPENANWQNIIYATIMEFAA